MSIEVTGFCPLGSVCEEVRDGKIHRCHWHCTLAGVDPQTGQGTEKKSCAMAFLPLLMIDQCRSIGGLQAATESHRNHTAKAAEMLATRLTPGTRAIEEGTR